MANMRILLVAGIFPPEIGGPATYASEMVKELPKKGIEVGVLPFRSVAGWPKILKHFIFFLKIIFQSVGKDAVFVQDTLSTGFPAVMASFVTWKPTVLRCPGDNVWEQAAQRFGVKENIDDFQHKKYGVKVEFLRSLQRFAVRHATQVYAPSFYFSKLVAGWNGGKKEVKAIYNGIDLNFQPTGEKYGELTMVTAGRLVSWKGIDGLLELLVEMPEWRLKIAGEGPERANLEKKATGLGVNERVDFLGLVPRAELMELVARSHVFVLNTFFESFSFQVVEALASGTPVITTNVGNLPEIINHEENGVLVSPGDVASIKKYIDKIMNEPDFKEKLVKGGVERSKDFSVEKTMDQLSLLLKSTIKNKS